LLLNIEHRANSNGSVDETPDDSVQEERIIVFMNVFLYQSK